MKTIWVIQYNDGTADVFDSEQGAPALPYIDAFEVQNRIAELERSVASYERLLDTAFDDFLQCGDNWEVKEVLEDLLDYAPRRNWEEK